MKLADLISSLILIGRFPVIANRREAAIELTSATSNDASNPQHSQLTRLPLHQVSHTKEKHP